MAKRTEMGLALEASLKEAIAHSKGKVELPTRVIEPMPASRVKAIRKAYAKNTREFEYRFGIPARTIEGWEQGKHIDVASRVLLKVIEEDPEAVEKVVAAA